MNNIKYSYGDKKPKRMWVRFFIETEYNEKEECNLGYLGAIEIGLNKGTHTYVKGVWCYHIGIDKSPYMWNEAIKKYNIDFNKYLEDALQFAIEKNYCK